MRVGAYGVAPQPSTMASLPFPVPSLQGTPRLYGPQQAVASNSWIAPAHVVSSNSRMAPPLVSGGIVPASHSDIRPALSSSMVPLQGNRYSLVSSMSGLTPRSMERSFGYSISATSGALTAGGQIQHQSLRVVQAVPNGSLNTDAARVEGGLTASQAPHERGRVPASPTKLTASPKQSSKRRISYPGRARSSDRSPRSFSTPPLESRVFYAGTTEEADKRLTRVPDHKLVSVARGQTLSPGPAAYSPKEPQRKITGGGAKFGTGHRGPRVPNTPGPADYDNASSPSARTRAGACFGSAKAREGLFGDSIGRGPDYSPRSSSRSTRPPGGTFGSGHRGPAIPKTPGPGDYRADAAKDSARPQARASAFPLGDAHLGPIELPYA